MDISQSKTISLCGSMLGNVVLTVDENPVDLQYFDRRKRGENTLVEPIKKYSVNPIRVTKAEFIPETAAGNPAVEFNGDTKLRMSLANVNDIKEIIRDVSPNNVKDAIIKFKATGEITIFSDYVGIVKEIVALNEESAKMTNKVISSLMDQVKTLTESCEVEKASCRSYMKSRGQNVDL